MQQVWIGSGRAATTIDLPAHDAEVLPGVTWGFASDPAAPAYWAARCRWPDDRLPDFIEKGRSLLEAVGFCLLGGFGIKYEINQAAFDRLQAYGAFGPDSSPVEADLARLLTDPLEVGGRHVRYRFPNQRARRLTAMHAALATMEIEDLPALEMRNRLQQIEGIGPKTASWIVRNFLGSDEVAIIDIHVIRACRSMSLFPDKFALPRDYAQLERRFLDFADGIGIQASVLDAVMWTEVREGHAYRRR